MSDAWEGRVKGGEHGFLLPDSFFRLWLEQTQCVNDTRITAREKTANENKTFACQCVRTHMHTDTHAPNIPRRESPYCERYKTNKMLKTEKILR